MDAVTKASPASSFRPAPARAIVVLPVSKDAEGNPNAVELERLPADKVGMILGGIPNTAKDPDAPEVVIKDFWKERAAELVAASAVSPRISVNGAGDGDCVEWDWLCVMDQVALFNGVMHLNGMLAEYPADLGRFLFQ